ncbi:MAG TPA: M23 family metallopeptidase [Candidatus Merdenecus merdavium]|nr:M23 family metallopeptidase [Candidatus Merdenecus merdavium]
MFKKIKLYHFIQLEFILLMVLAFILTYQRTIKNSMIPSVNTSTSQHEGQNSDSSKDAVKTDYIQWVDFKVNYAALEDTYHIDVESYESGQKLDWIDLLAYLGTKYGGDFSKYSKKDLNTLVETLKTEDQSLEDLTKDMEYFNYYKEAYGAVLNGLLGEYEIEVPKEEGSQEKVWVKKYGLKAFSPIAKGYEYYDYDDFGVSRSYGYSRPHLGHDMMGQVGTPITAVESGYVEAIGWNQYGGWRLGIRSFDKKRYYYYAHLRKNFPYNKSLEEGSIVQAGDVIGYLGRTGYSSTENVNNIKQSHLHFGLQLIFDESQKEGNNEIWIDCYDLIRFLYKNRSLTVKDEATKEYSRVYEIRDPVVEEYQRTKDMTIPLPNNNKYVSPVAERIQAMEE